MILNTAIKPQFFCIVSFVARTTGNEVKVGKEEKGTENESAFEMGNLVAATQKHLPNIRFQAKIKGNLFLWKGT